MKNFNSGYYGFGKTHEVYWTSRYLTRKLVSRCGTEKEMFDREFNWGYCGAGPNVLAYSILFNETSDREFSLKFTTKFRDEFLFKSKMDTDIYIESEPVKNFIKKEKGLI